MWSAFNWYVGCKKITIKIIIDLLFKDIFLNSRKYTTISCKRLWVNAEIQLIDSNDKYFLNLYRKIINNVLISPALKLIIKLGVNSVPNIRACIKTLSRIVCKAIFELNFSSAISTDIFDKPIFIQGNGLGIIFSIRERYRPKSTKAIR